MIIIITYKDKKTGLITVSHGYDLETDKIIPMPQIPLSQINVKYNTQIGEYILEEN